MIHRIFIKDELISPRLNKELYNNFYSETESYFVYYVKHGMRLVPKYASKKDCFVIDDSNKDKYPEFLI